MKLLVCVKAIDAEPPRLRHLGGVPSFERSPVTGLVPNESDAQAVDVAVALARTALGRTPLGRVSVVTVGPLEARDVLMDALARGADAALRIDADTQNPLEVARLLAAFVDREPHDLILTGAESADGLASAVGPALAARLDRPFACAVSHIEADAKEARVTREAGGQRATLTLPLPAVVSVKPGIVAARRPSPLRLARARRARTRSLSAAQLGVEREARAPRVVSIATPRNERSAEMLEGRPDQVARELMRHIRAALASS